MNPNSITSLLTEVFMRTMSDKMVTTNSVLWMFAIFGTLLFVCKVFQ